MFNNGITKLFAATSKQLTKCTEQKVASATKILTPLKADIVELSNAAASRWAKNAEEYIPAVFEGSALPMHHKISGINTSVRDFIKYKKTGIIPYENKRDIEWFLGEIKQGEKAVDEIDKAFQKLSPLEKDCIVYRGRAENPIFKENNVDFAIIDKAKIGDIIIPDTAYSYCAFKKSLANCWGGPGARAFSSADEPPNRIMMMTIRLPKGAKVSRNLEHGGEIVMPRSAEYKVISKEIKNNDIETTLEYILPQT